MREMRNILSWLGMEREESILKEAQEHVEETHNTVQFFAQAVAAFIRGDINAKAAAIASVGESEHKADILRSKMVSALSEGLLLPPDREDLMHFVKTLDKIADWTNGAARILGFIETRPPEEVLKNISCATEIIVNSVSRLKEAIRALTQNNIKKAIADSEEVDRLEHEADDQKKLLIESILHAHLESTGLVLTYQLAEYLEGVTDKIEDAAEVVRILAIKSK